MALQVYNTLKKKKEAFKPRSGKKVNIFVCGPTVYDFSHIGHAKTYVAFDVIVRYLRAKSYDVFYLQNITDIDDKIIKEARAKGIDPLKFSEKFTKEYYKDMKALRITTVDKYAKASDHVKDIISQVRRLIKKNIAYELNDGIYFDITAPKDYGKLSGRTYVQEEDSVSRIDESIDKKNKGDFNIWKFSKPGDPIWKTELGEGRPGWHIEDTAITEHYFGPQYDIHGGAKDLIFPHHENEIAIMESISGKKPLVKYWFHTGFLNVEGRKMSKSLGNFITIRDALKKWDVDTFRMMFVSTHYRSPIDYSEASLRQAKANLETIRTAVEAGKKKISIKKWIDRFEALMDDDFNTPKVVALLLEIAKHINKTGEDLSSVIYSIGEILGVDFRPHKAKIPTEIKKLVAEREKARAKKDWAKSDKIRDELKKKGWTVEDSSKGAKVKKLF